MATLVTDEVKKQKLAKRHGKSKVLDENDHAKKERRKLEKKLEKEYSKVRFHFEDVRQAFKYADDASADEDVYYRLLLLEQSVRRVRRGSLFGHGAKLHRRILQKLKRLPIE